MMKNILYIPLDERPCNAKFLSLLTDGTEYQLITPEEALSGYKKTPAQIDQIWAWIFRNLTAFDTAILSIDMLIYGGIVPSRIHDTPTSGLLERLHNLERLKEQKPDLKLYAFHLIMRCPSYSSSDEEPDYYEAYGADLFRYGVLSHKSQLALINDVEKEEFHTITTRLPKDVLQNYTDRRAINKQINLEAIRFVKNGIIDFLVIPQDDSAPLGFTAMDQHELKEYIHDRGLDSIIHMYPGADEVAMTLFARLLNNDKGRTPHVYVRFSSAKGPSIIPLYEDRMMMETIHAHILCAGAVPVDDLASADLVLMINSPAEKMYEAWEQNNLELVHNTDENLVEFVAFMDSIITQKHLPCAVADVAFSNGGDLRLIHTMAAQKILFEVASYAGWNTNANTLGTSICQAMIYNIYGKTAQHLDFLALRYTEDIGYCSVVRKEITDHQLSKLGLNYFEVDGIHGAVSKIVKSKLEDFVSALLIDNPYQIIVRNAAMPWNRMFEVDVDVDVDVNIIQTTIK